MGHVLAKGLRISGCKSGAVTSRLIDTTQHVMRFAGAGTTLLGSFANTIHATDIKIPTDKSGMLAPWSAKLAVVTEDV